MNHERSTPSRAPGPPGAVVDAPRRRRRHLLNGVTVGLVVALAGAGGVLLATNSQEGRVERVEGIDTVLTEKMTGWENYLLVGSDTREGADPSSSDAGSIGDTEDVQGRRSDTVMVLHVDHDAGTVGLMSIPRDLYVDIPGFGPDRINSAYSHGEDVLIRTLQESLGIPVNHYIEVDFFGFKDIVDALGGVEACFDAPTRDKNTGLAVPVAGCFTLNGVQGLQYARSRYYERFVDGEWQMDGRSDLGRIERQQGFITSAVAKVLERSTENPLALNEIVRAVTSAVRADPRTDLVTAANQLRPLASGGITRYALPVDGITIDGKQVLQLGEGASAILAYFGGTAPAPPPAASEAG